MVSDDIAGKVAISDDEDVFVSSVFFGFLKFIKSEIRPGLVIF